MSVRVFAPAKINLTLEVGRPRADGMHPLQSVVAFADVGDWVSAFAASELTLAIEGPFANDLSPGEDNLVVRAARALAEAASVAPNARLELEKHLPVASGIGGGSADAAATLRALNGLWALDWSEARLAALGRSLGADVAAFFCGARSALMRGVGEAVTPLALPLLHAVLANPRAPLATAAVYAEFDRMGLGRDKFTDQQSWNSLLHAATNVKAIGNDLAPAAVSLLPAITAVMDALGADSRSECAALSGSGATVFALAPTRDAAESLARDLASRRPWWVRAVALAGP